MLIMNFLDSFLEKIPIIRDMDKKKRILAAGFLVFALVSLLGILIDAIAEAGGVVALISVAIGFLLMAALIIADFIMSRKAPPEYPQRQEQYNFYDDNPDNYGYQDEAYDYRTDGQADDTYDNRELGDEIRDDGFAEELNYGDADGFREGDSYQDDFAYQDDGLPDDGQDYRDDAIEYTVTPDPSSLRDMSHDVTHDVRREPEGFRRQTPSRFEFRPSQPESVNRAPVLYDENAIGKPVMMFDAPSQPVRDEVRFAAETVAPQVIRPEPSDAIGGPVMSIPFRGVAPEPAEETRKVELNKAAKVEPVQPQPIKSAYAARREERGQEIEEFFDHMSDDEILYSDCVEVWASDAKPAAIRLLKQVETLGDKKMADSLGREAEYVNAMLDRIYYFTMLDSIKENLELKKYNFSAMVKECLRRFSPFFMEKRIGLLWRGLDIDIVTDKRWLIFALTQVVFNAVEFTGLGGKIAISAKKEGSMIHLMVDDSGCGISDEDLPRIFMAGFMGDNAPNEEGRRTGMGLFITRSVIEKLGGSVTAESTVGKGTRVTMILPKKI